MIIEGTTHQDDHFAVELENVTAIIRSDDEGAYLYLSNGDYIHITCLDYEGLLSKWKMVKDQNKSFKMPRLDEREIDVVKSYMSHWPRRLMAEHFDVSEGRIRVIEREAITKLLEAIGFKKYSKPRPR